MKFHNHLHVEGHLNCLFFFVLLYYKQYKKHQVGKKEWGGGNEARNLEGGLGLEKKQYVMVKIIPNTSIITKIDNKSFLKKENKKNFLSTHYMPGSQGTETDRQS